MDDITKPVNQNPATISDAAPLPVLPSSIIDHLNSRASLDTMYAIENDFSIGVGKTRVIPVILEALITGEMEPQNVIEALKIGLGATPENAKKIAGILKDKILNPIAGGLLITTGIDIEPIPGPSAKDARDLPELVEQLKPYLPQKEEVKALAMKTETKKISDLEPLIASPQNTGNQQATPTPGIGMGTPGLRTMRDVKQPAVPVQKTETTQAPAAPKVVAAPRPFMLHEEKPLAPSESTGLHVDKSFSFDAGQNPVQKPVSRPVAAQFGSSFDSVLETQKPAAPVVAKTPAEAPKVIHYTNFKTALDENGNPKK